MKLESLERRFLIKRVFLQNRHITKQLRLVNLKEVLMEKNKKKEYSKEKSGNEMQVLFMLGVGLAALWASQSERLIRAWFFDNMFMLILSGIGLLGALGYYLNYRFKKNNKEFLERARQVQLVKTNKSVDQFYQRKPSYGNTNKGGRLNE